MGHQVAGEAGPVRDVVLANAAAALVVADGWGQGAAAEGLGAAVDRAREALDSGAVARLLGRWSELSRERVG